MEINSIKKFYDIEEEMEYKYKVLIYPNITFQKEFTKDSFYVIMSNILKHLTKLRPDTHFTILTPKEMPGFMYDNVEQVIYDLPTYPNTMRCHFDTKKILEIIDWKNKEWDFVYTYLPEHTLALKNIFHNSTNIRPIFFGYSAYIEIPETTNYDMAMIKSHYSGILEMEKCGVNSQSVKNTIMKYAPEHLPEKDVKKLDTIIHSVPRGFDNIKTTKLDVQKDPKIIVFNHRANAYKSYDWFIEQMDTLWKTRQDFKVWVPLADNLPVSKSKEINDSRKMYMDIKSVNRENYFKKLSSCYVGVCGRSYHTGWANSASDGMSVGVPYIFLNADYYYEYAEEAGIYFTSNSEFQEYINKILNDGSYRENFSHRSIEMYEKKQWSIAIHKYNEDFIYAENQLYKLREKSESYKRIVNLIKSRGYVSKYDILDYLGWGIRITYSPYRNLLRDEPNIKFCENGYEWIT